MAPGVREKMIALLDTNEALDVCAAQLGCEVHQLLTPAPGFCRQKEHDWFAIDNGAFSGFDVRAFVRIIKRESHAKQLCKFVVVPDVVGSAVRTLEVFEHWRYRLSGWPLALAAQDGLENIRIPKSVWAGIDAIFIGGSTEWKLGPYAVQAIRTAQAMNKWVHVGRVNTPDRFDYFDNLGVDSIDGTGLARYTHMREAIWRAKNEPNLLTGLAPSAENSSAQAVSKSTAEIATASTTESAADPVSANVNARIAAWELRDMGPDDQEPWYEIERSRHADLNARNGY